MKYPPEIIPIIQKISKKLAKKFKFGSYEHEDIEQEAFIYGLEGYEKWDQTRPLANFLWVHIKNRLCNLKRQKYDRKEKPCAKCPFFDQHCLQSTNQCSKYENKEDCRLYYLWIKRNDTKKSLSNASPSNVDYEFLNDNILIFDSIDIENNYYYELIDKFLPANLRKYYVRLKLGDKLNKAKYDELMAAIKQIFIDNNVDGINKDE